MTRTGNSTTICPPWNRLIRSRTIRSNCRAIPLAKAAPHGYNELDARKKRQIMQLLDIFIVNEKLLQKVEAKQSA